MGLLAQMLAQQKEQAPAGEIPAWVDELAKRNALGDSPYEKEPDTSYSLPGFVANVGGDVVDFAKGLASLVGLGAGDVYNVAADVAETVTPLGNQDRNYYTDDILKSLVFDPGKLKGGGSILEAVSPAIQEDIRTRYGGGLDSILKGLYNDPLYYAADAFTVGELAGQGLVQSGKAAMRVPGIAEELGRLGATEKRALLAKFGGDPENIKLAQKLSDYELENLSPIASQAKRTLPGAGWGKLLEGLEPEEASKLAAHLGMDPERTFSLGGLRGNVRRSGKPEPYFTEASANPFRRAVRDTTRKIPGISTSVDKLVKQAGELAAHAGVELTSSPLEALQKAPDSTPAALGEYTRTIEVARRFGIERVDAPMVEKIKTSRAFDKISGNFITRFYGGRDEDINRIFRRIENEMDELVVQRGGQALSRAQKRALINDNLDAAHLWMQVDTRRSPGRYGFQDVVDLFRARSEAPVDEADVAALRTGGVPLFEGDIVMPSHAEARAWVGKIDQLLPGRVVSVVLPDGARPGYVELATGARIRLLTGASREAFEAIDSLIPRYANVVEQLQELQAKIARAVPAEQAKLQAQFIEAQREAMAIVAEVEDLTEHAVVWARRDAGEQVDAQAALVAGLRVDRHNMTIAPGLKRGKFSSVAALRERMYLPIKLEMYAHQGGVLQKAFEVFNNTGDLTELNKLGFTDPKQALKALIDQGGASKADKRLLLEKARLDQIAGVDAWEHLDTLYRNSGRQAPIYFPHMDPRLNNASDMLFKKSTVGMNKLKDGSRYKRALGWLYLDNAYELNPLDAYARAASQTRRYLDMEDMADEITRMGRIIRSPDDLGPNEALWAPDLFKRLVRTRAEVELSVMKHLLDGLDEQKAWTEGFTDAMKSLDQSEFDLEGLIDDMAESFGGVERARAAIEKLRVAEATGDPALIAEAQQISGVLMAQGKTRIYAIPKVVANRLDKMGKFQLGWAARVYWDGPMNLWRSAVLAFSPRWIFYNLLGNITFLKMQGGSLVDVLRLVGGKAGSKMFGEEFSAPFAKRVEALMEALRVKNPDLYHNLRGGFFSEVQHRVTHMGTASDTLPGQMALQAQAGRNITGDVVARFSRGAQRMRRLNELIEDSFRQASFLTALERKAAEAGIRTSAKSFLKGLDTLDDISRAGIDDGLAAAALDEVNYFFNDYTRMGPIERNVIRRFIAPFYSFYKHVAKLVTTYPFEHPVRAQVIRQLGEISREMASEFGTMPEWLVGSIPIGEGASEDETRFLNTRGANPFNALLSPWESLGTSMAPQWKMLLEQITGRSMLTGKPFTSGDTFTPYGSTQAYSINPETGDVDPTTVRPDLLTHLMQQFPQARAIADVVEWARHGTTGARYSGTGDVMTDASGQPVFRDDPLLNVLSLGGLSTTDFALDEYQTSQREQERAALIGWLRRNGLLAEAS